MSVSSRSNAAIFVLYTILDSRLVPCKQVRLPSGPNDLCHLKLESGVALAKSGWTELVLSDLQSVGHERNLVPFAFFADATSSWESDSAMRFFDEDAVAEDMFESRRMLTATTRVFISHPKRNSLLAPLFKRRSLDLQLFHSTSTLIDKND